MFMADELGDSSPVYAQWTARMQGLGGQISAVPNDPKPLYIDGKTFPRVAAVFRDPAVWVPKVNARALPTPDTYSRDGRTAYFVAPRDVQMAARQAFAPTAANVAAAAQEIGTSWWSSILAAPRNAIAKVLGIPGWAVTAAIGVGAFFLVKQLLPVVGARFARSNPRGRRRRRLRRSRR